MSSVLIKQLAWYLISIGLTPAYDDTNYPIKPNVSSLAEHFYLEKQNVLHPPNYRTNMRY